MIGHPFVRHCAQVRTTIFRNYTMLEARRIVKDVAVCFQKKKSHSAHFVVAFLGSFLYRYKLQ
jgi:hypothetical protein